MPRSRDQVVWDFVQSWLRKAEGDLRVCKHLQGAELGDYFALAFHAQQAAEKFLKAFLVRHQIPFPKTHDIQRLLDLVAQADPSLKAELASAAMLTPFGVEFRYPGQELADVEVAQGAMQEAEQVQASVLARLRAYLEQGRPA